MIHYALVCDQHHEFESWFANSAAYDDQVKRGLVTCPSCSSAKVEKALMTPRLARSHTRPRQEGPEEAHQLLQKKETSARQSAEAASDAMSRPAPVAMMTPR